MTDKEELLEYIKSLPDAMEYTLFEGSEITIYIDLNEARQQNENKESNNGPIICVTKPFIIYFY